ncbi:hypothetical protein X975_19759, partial [Stegodyphus mimosarum]
MNYYIKRQFGRYHVGGRKFLFCFSQFITMLGQELITIGLNEYSQQITSNL